MTTNIKTWQERLSESNYALPGDSMLLHPVTLAMEAEIADLRAELARRDAVEARTNELAEQALERVRASGFKYTPEWAASVIAGNAHVPAVVSEGQAATNQLWNALSLMLDTFERPIGMYANERRVCDIARAALAHPAAPVAEAPTDPDVPEAIRLLGLMADGYESGISCTEGFEDGTYIGNAFRLADEDENAIYDLLNRRKPPRYDVRKDGLVVPVTAPATEQAKAEQHESDWRNLIERTIERLNKAQIFPLADELRKALTAQVSPAKPDLAGLMRYDIGESGQIFAPNDGSYVLFDDVEALLAAITKET